MKNRTRIWTGAVILIGLPAAVAVHIISLTGLALLSWEQFAGMMLMEVILAFSGVLILAALGWLISIAFRRRETLRMKLLRFLKVMSLYAGGGLAVLLVAFAVLRFVSDTRLNNKLAELRAAGEPVSLADLARPSIPPEKNAATFLRRAKSDYDAINRELEPVYARKGYSEGQLTGEDAATIRSAFDAYPQLLPLLEQAAVCPDHDFGFDYTVDGTTFMKDMLDPIQEFRALQLPLRARVRQLIHEGQRDEALKMCLLMFRLCHHVNREPFLINFLVSCACRSVAVTSASEVLTSGSVSEAMRHALGEELARHEMARIYQHALRYERAFGLTHFRDTIPWISRIMFGNDQRYYIEIISEQMALVDRPYHEAAEVFRKRMVEPKTGRMLSSLVLPAIEKSREAAEYCRASLRCLQVLNSLQALVEKHPGIEPKLADLELPDEVITDPFDGKDLHIKKTDAGYIVYSVGKNLKDDGGEFGDRKDVVVGSK